MNNVCSSSMYFFNVMVHLQTARGTCMYVHLVSLIIILSSFLPSFWESLLILCIDIHATSAGSTITGKLHSQLFRKSFTFGLSCALPLCLCCPKNFSIGSWHILLFSSTLTPGILAKKNFTRCTNESTRGEGIKYNYACIMYKGNSPVIRRPSRVSELSNIAFCCV